MTSTSPSPAVASGYASFGTDAGPDQVRTEPVLLLDRLRPGKLVSGTVLLGVTGSLLMTIMATGAGAILVTDPLFSGSPLSWIRYGHGQQLATAGLYGGAGMLIWAWIRLGRSVLNGTATAQQVKVAAALWIAPILFSPPLFSRDAYGYLGQGALALRGLDPYQVGPSKLPPGAIADNVHYVWQTTPAPYGPMFIFIAKTMNWLTGDNLILGLIGMRLVLMSGLALLVFALPRLADRLGGDRARALWLVLANPITVVHLVGGPHNDLLMIGLVAAGTLLVLSRRHAGGIALVTVAMAVKASAGIVLPFLVWIWVAHLPGSRRSRLLRAGACSAGVFLAVFTGITAISGVGLGWIPALDTPSLIVNFMSLPTAAGELSHVMVTPFAEVSERPFVLVFRVLGIAVFLAVFAWQWWLARDGGPQTIRRATFALLWGTLLAPATLPWYFSWTLVLGAVLTWPRRWLGWAVVGSIWMVLCTYPTGEAAFGSWCYQLGLVAVSLIGGSALLKKDPLGLRRRAPAVDAAAPQQAAAA